MMQKAATELPVAKHRERNACRKEMNSIHLLIKQEKRK